MKISFDFDDTLIPTGKPSFPTESRNIFQKIVGVEPIRQGSVEIFNFLKSRSHTVGIYTSSFRSPRYIWWQLFTYGTVPDFIIQGDIHQKTLKPLKINPSKYPPAFDIQLHIDDSPGVAVEGERFGFYTLIISPTERHWIEKIKAKF